VTRGMIDNAISPQEVKNKAVSQFVHILNTTANSGWIVEQNSLANMATEDLEQEGSKTGLLLVVKPGTQQPPKKIEPNQIPTGIDKLIDRATETLKSVTIPDAMKGLEGQEISGIAIQSKQFAAQNQLAIPLDNLARTRHMVADFVDYLISTFYDNQREFRITETDPRTGKEITVPYNVNQPNPMGGWSNDLTVGDYDTVVSEVPMQVTYENSQFQQGLELRKAGVNVPDNIIIKHSNLADKGEILDQMENQGPPPMSPLDQAKTALVAAQEAEARAKADKLQAETANTRITSQFGAVQTAQVIAQLPAVAPLADALTRSAGVVDEDGPPEIPAPAPGALQPVGAGSQHPGPIVAPGVPGMPRNTHPLEPASPDRGERVGIEGGK